MSNSQKSSDLWACEFVRPNYKEKHVFCYYFRYQFKYIFSLSKHAGKA